jgi:uncharacterized membrane protein
MQVAASSNSFAFRLMLTGVWGTICTLTIAAPILLSYSYNTASAFLYVCFSGLCHQIPERSFLLSGHSLAVCHRCFGIYIGFFLGSLNENRFIHRSPQIRRLWTMAAIAPLLLDALLSFSGIWHSAGLMRFFTGFIFGALIAPLLVRGVAELLHEAPWRRLADGGSHFEGDIT